jgi:hypothetical protein
MADYALFISEQEVKELTPTDENVDEKIIRIAIETAQEIYIIRLLGSGLFDELQTQILSGTTTSENVTLLSKLKNTMLWYTLYELHPYLNYKYMNKGIMQRGGENVTVTDEPNMNSLRNEARSKAELFASRFRKWLIENESTYPLFLNPGNEVDTIYPENDSFEDWGIYLGNIGKAPTKLDKLNYPGIYGEQLD